MPRFYFHLASKDTHIPDDSGAGVKPQGLRAKVTASEYLPSVFQNSFVIPFRHQISDIAVEHEEEGKESGFIGTNALVGFSPIQFQNQISIGLIIDDDQTSNTEKSVGEMPKSCVHAQRTAFTDRKGPGKIKLTHV